MDPILSIVVPTDFSPLSEAAALRAATFAADDRTSIHLVHAVRFPMIASPYEISVPAAIWEGVRQGAEEKLERLRGATEKETGRTITAEISDSKDPIKAIAQSADARDADLIVMGTHGYSGIQQLFLGSVAEQALRSLDRPILAVKEELARAAAPIEKILLAVDFSDHSRSAAEFAAGLAERFSASVDIVHAFDLPRDYVPYASTFGAELAEKIQSGAAERVNGVRERFEKRQIQVAVHCQRGQASRLIAEIAREIGADLIVMGRRGTSGLSHLFLGSVAERTVRTAHCSVLAVKAEADQP